MIVIRMKIFSEQLERNESKDGMANIENEKCIELCIFMLRREGWRFLGKRPFVQNFEF